MKPIAQTFLIPEPDTGAEAVFLTSIDLYFQSKSSVYGVEIQIRETENGYPTQRVLPYSSKILEASSVNISSDASVATTFIFDSPVILRANEQFAIVVVPVGGNPDYNIWTAALGEMDAKTNTPIYTSNQLGSLFISSNDLNFTPIQSESVKYTLRIANFTASSGTAVYRNVATDTFKIRNIIGNFAPGEQVVVSNNTLSFSSLTVSMASAFTVGEIVVQPNTATTIYNATAYGKVLLANTTTLVLGNTSGSFSTTGGGLKGLSSTLTAAQPSAANISVITSSSNTMTIPVANLSVASDIAVNNYIYVAANTRSTTKIAKITGTSTAGLVTTLNLDSNVGFTDGAALIGRIRADANLVGYYSASSRSNAVIPYITLTDVSSNSSQNFTNVAGQYLIGRSSGASALNIDIMYRRYDSITPQFTNISPKQTNVVWSFAGSSSNTLDSSYSYLDINVPYEFIDKERNLLSRSQELSANSSGSSSLYVQAELTTSNSYISPYIDKIHNSVALAHNMITSNSNMSGYMISYSNSSSNASATFVAGNIIWQSNSTVNASATIINANNTVLIVQKPTSSNTLSMAAFNANGTSIITSNNGVVANVTGIAVFGEANNPITRYGSRYISKNVILADLQDAEDLIAYVSAYRPSGSNIQVYCKLLSAADSDAFDTKHWSAMIETSNPSLVSSLANRDDLVEISYELPSSIQVYNANASGNTSSVNLTFDSSITTANFSPSQFIYVTDVATGKINVRQIVSIANTSTIVMSSPLSITTANAAVGYIPGLESQYGAFKHANNQSICKYMNGSDNAFDSFKTFAIKLVLTSNTSYIVPRVSDFRSIALQI